ncbi:MAG: gliding motility lipoprotein GldH [Flavobacteriales bacterium]
MIKSVKYATCLLILVALVSCNRNKIYEEHKELSPNVQWKKEDVRKFEVPIKDTDKKYDLSLALRYVSGYPWKKAVIKVKEISPSGKVTEKKHELKIKDENGDYIGEPGMDIWDSTHLVEEGKKYKESGTYTYKLQHAMPKDPFPFVMEAGVIVEINPKAK